MLKRYASNEDGILLEARRVRAPVRALGVTTDSRQSDLQEFSMFISAAAKTHELLALIPLDLLHDVRSLFGLVSRSGKSLDRQVRRARPRARRCERLAAACSLSHTCALPTLSGVDDAGARDAGSLPRP